MVDPGKKTKRSQSNPESSRPCHEDKFVVAPLLFDIGSVDKETDSINNSTALVERLNTFKGNEGLQL